jgi:hypothetical protein
MAKAIILSIHSDPERKFLYKERIRQPQRSWKVHRKTKYHRLAGLRAKDVQRLFKFLEASHHRARQNNEWWYRNNG